MQMFRYVTNFEPVNVDVSYNEVYVFLFGACRGVTRAGMPVFGNASRSQLVEIIKKMKIVSTVYGVEVYVNMLRNNHNVNRKYERSSPRLL